MCYWFVISCWNHLFTRVEGTRPMVNKIDPGYQHWHDTMAKIMCRDTSPTLETRLNFFLNIELLEAYHRIC